MSPHDDGLAAHAELHIPAMGVDPQGQASGPGVLRLAEGEVLSWHPFRAARNTKMRINADPREQVRLMRYERNGEFVCFAAGDMVWHVAQHHATYVQSWADEAWAASLKRLSESSQPAA